MEQINPKNNLPKYWAVKNDGSQLFKDTVIKYMNDNYAKNEISWQAAHLKCFYGYDGNNTKGMNGTNVSLIGFDDFVNPVTQLSIQEFIELSKPIEGDNNVKFEDLGPPPIDEDSVTEHNNLPKLPSGTAGQIYNHNSNQYEDQKWEPKYGEIVWAWDDNIDKDKQMFVAKCPNEKYPYICAHEYYGKDKGLTFNLMSYQYISRFTEPKEYTIQEVAKALGEEVGNFKIKLGGE
jgi:hypothetical protein